MLSVYTPAKVNLFLNIREPRTDGYHEICSVMQAIGLWDRLDVTPILGDIANVPDVIEPGIHFSCNLMDLIRRPEENLVVKAYQLFWQETDLTPLPLHVYLEKGIPLEAGLGGGSSDAAAMLLILNHLSLAGLSEEELRKMGAKLGSDVPFFIRGGRAVVTGYGDQVEPLTETSGESSLVIIKPRQFGIATSEAYRTYDEQARYDHVDPSALLDALNAKQSVSSSEAVEEESQHDQQVLDPESQATSDTTRNTDDVFAPPAWDTHLFNDFESVLFPSYPGLSGMARKMRAAGIRRPLLSGSGAAMLGFVESDLTHFRAHTRPALLQAFPPEQFQMFRTATWSGGLIQVSGSFSPSLEDTTPAVTVVAPEDAPNVVALDPAAL
jgi:4-diphosphocytidyl-2-C-methyl-D-erythritol kinase